MFFSIFPPKPKPDRKAPPPSLTEGSLPHAVWNLAWPTVMTNLLWSGTGLINMMFVGRLGKDALAVVGRSEQIMFLLMSIITSVSVGSSALVARSIGANDLKSAEIASRQSLIMAALGGLLSSLLLLLFGPVILWGMAARGEELASSIRYVQILAGVQVQVFFMIVIGAIYRGVGDTRTPMYIMGVVNLLQIAGDWTLIFGVGPFPHLGVVGAAWSWMISRTVGVVLSFYFLWRSPLAHTMKGDLRPQWDWFRRIWAVGLPTAIQQTLRLTGSMVFLGILGRLPHGTAAVATLTVGMRIESLAFMPGFGYSMAAMTLVGQNLGAQKPERAERAGWVCAWQAMGIMTLCGLAFLLIPQTILRIFTHDPDVLRFGTGYLYANGIAQPFLALGIALSGALQGAGETRLPAWITFFTMWFIRVPLTYLFAVSLGLGTMAAWGVMALTNITYGVIITLFFRRGDWKTKEV
ncbi:MAG: MATE family efflux transporter [Armatimonadetes bacterium]|nr:MATE family efflux transporter [Armatimonadota bacterium]